MLLPDGVVDIVSAFAAPLTDSTWSMEPFQRLAMPVVSRGRAGWCMASYGEASHFMAAVPAAIRLVSGRSAIAEGARKGYHVMPTVADGGCGPHPLLHVLCEHRGRERRQEIRQQIRDVLYRNAGSAVWHGIAEACQEIDAAPAVAGPSAAQATNVSAAAPGVAGSEAAVVSSSSAFAAPAVAGPSVAQSAAGPGHGQPRCSRRDGFPQNRQNALAARPSTPNISCSGGGWPARLGRLETIVLAVHRSLVAWPSLKTTAPTPRMRKLPVDFDPTSFMWKGPGSKFSITGS
jgi:hypothetical protein